MDEKVREQIMAIRDTGKVNMLSVIEVQLVLYIEEHRREYWHFIMTGETEES